MKSLEIIAHPANKQELSVIKAFFKALKINFQIQKEESPYDPEFVEKIKESLQQVKEGKVHRVKKENLSKFIGLE